MTDTDPSAGQPRDHGAYSTRLARQPEPGVDLDPSYKALRFPSDWFRPISYQDAAALVGALQVPKADPERPDVGVTTYARLNGPTGTVSAVTYQAADGFTIVFAGGAVTGDHREQATLMQATQLRAELIDRFDLAIDEMD